MTDIPPDEFDDDTPALPADSGASLGEIVEGDEQRDIDQGEEKDRK